MSGFVPAREVVSRLMGRWAGRRGTCRCPAHEDSSPSLSVSETRDGRVLVHCFAGCDQMAVIDALKRLGLWGDGEVIVDPSYPGHFTTRHDDIRERDDRSRRIEAQDIWDRARVATGTKAEAYLRARGIKLPIPDQIRFIGSLAHGPSGNAFPAMIARIADARGLCAVQRTYLSKTDALKADIKPNKMSKGPMGAGAVRLREPKHDQLGLAEGIETALSASQLYSIPVWATLSANRLGKIEIPPSIRVLHIFGDAGDVGKAEAFKAADHYEKLGLHVECVFPAAHFKGQHSDFNDVLRGIAA